MSNKKQLQAEAEVLRKQLSKLEDTINRLDEEEPYEVTSYKELCKRLGEKQYSLSDFDFIENTKDRMKSFRLVQIKQLERYFNKALDFTIDWSNANQYKYYPWFEYKSRGWSFDGVGFRCCFSCCSDGEPAYFKDEKTVKHIIKYFEDIYIDYIKN